VLDTEIRGFVDINRPRVVAKVVEHQVDVHVF